MRVNSRFTGKTAKIYVILHEGRPIYVGSTTVALHTRLGAHYSRAKYGVVMPLYDWMRAHEMDSLALEIAELASCPVADRYKLEVQYIMKHKTSIRYGGFNLAHTNVSRKRRADAGTSRAYSPHIARGPQHYQHGKPMPEHIKEAAREANTGRKMGAEHKRKLHTIGREKMISSWGKKVKCVETGEVFKSVMDACRFARPGGTVDNIAAGAGSIRVCLKKNDKGIPASALGYHWERVTQ
jgi:hypothetical protein